MNRLERLYAINEILRRRSEPISAATLADRFGVTRRTIERDLAALRQAGVPVYAEAGRTGGQISLEDAPGGGQVVVTLAPAEVAALLVAVAAGGEDMPFVEAATSATERLLDGLPVSTRLAVDELRSRIRTASGDDPDGPAVKRRVRHTIEEAVRRRVVVNLDYTDRNGRSTSRAVDAIGLYQGGDGWFLIGWCHLREAGRIFRLDRIGSARLTRRPAPDRDVDATLGWVPNDVTPL